MKKLVLCAGVFLAVFINAHLASNTHLPSRTMPADQHERASAYVKIKPPATAITAALVN